MGFDLSQAFAALRGMATGVLAPLTRPAAPQALRGFGGVLAEPAGEAPADLACPTTQILFHVRTGAVGGARARARQGEGRPAGAGGAPPRRDLVDALRARRGEEERP